MSCCPSRPAQAPLGLSAIRPPLSAASERPALKTVTIPGGKAFVGTAKSILPQDGEGPFRQVSVRPFQISATAVTNEEFSEFVKATGYQTDAERFGWSFVFYLQVPPSVPLTRAVMGVEWWRQVSGATWREPFGPDTAKEAFHADHPVVHVSWNDAQAYASWVGGRLATEVEWEHAARGGLGDVRFPWGDLEPDDVDHFPCNIWQGTFPRTNTAADGYIGTAPVRSYQPNGYGLYNMCGNVWEWTADPFRLRSISKHARERMEQLRGYKVSKGGSYLCHKSYCYRYRIAARSATSPESTTSHHGFRVVWPAIRTT